MRPRFFVDVATVSAPGLPSPAESGAEVGLSAPDAHHAAHVLRLRPGDECEVVLTPVGRLYSAAVSRVSDSHVWATLGELIPVTHGRLRVRLVQALPELRSMDAILTKGTEVGVDEFVLVAAAGSPAVPRERVPERVERWRKLVLEAAKQSKQLGVPEVRAAAFSEAVEQSRGTGRAGVVCEPSASRSLEEVLRELQHGGGPECLDLWVGPEGGWSAGEIELFRARGLSLVRLGRRILRAETAGPVAAAVARFALGDW